MLYCIDQTADEPIMLINKHIGFDENEGQGIDGSLFQSELLQLDSLGKKRIQVWINSPGGIVMDGYNIYNAILKSKTKVDTYCVGICASIAAVIFQAGRTRYMADYGKLMYHNAHGGDNKQLGVLNDSIAVMVGSRSGKPKEEVLKMMDRTTWIGASEAFASGFCDVIEASNEYNRKRVTASEPKMMWAQSAEVLNSILSNNNKTITMLTKVTNKLGLMESANEDAILSAITAIENKAVSFENELKDAKNKLSEKETELNSVKNELNTLKTEKENAVKAAKEAEEKAFEEKAKNMVEGYVKAGKIKSESVASWVNFAKTDFEGTEKMLKDLPVHKVSNKIEISEDKEAALTSVVAVTMRDVRNKLESK